MTLTEISKAQYPPATMFLNSVCPGIGKLEENTYFSLENDPSNSVFRAVDWPLGVGNCPKYAEIDRNYLNIARPPLSLTAGTESTTYVSLPYHITNLFRKIVATKEGRTDGSMHVGANVNPLVQDPFKLVHLNPGCLSAIIDVEESLPANSDLRSPLVKVTTSFNRLLKLTALAPAKGWKPVASGGAFDVLNYNLDVYSGLLKASRLLVSTNVNVLNVVAIGPEGAYSHPKSVTSDVPPIPVAEVPPEANSSQSSYTRVFEQPVLRLQFRHGVIATSMHVFSQSNGPLVALGLDSGDIMLVDLANATYLVLEMGIGSDSRAALFTNGAVTSLQTMGHPAYGYILVAGFANGEVAFLDPSAVTTEREGPRYSKRVVGADSFATYFKKCDLSPSGTREGNMNLHNAPSYLVGHFKVSHKAVTALCSTLPDADCPELRTGAPMIVAVASDDGLVRLLDLVFSADCAYGSPESLANNPFVSDILSNYFHDGITDVRFLPDHRFLCVAGKGDLIEVFRMAYYNINGLVRHSHSNVNLAATPRRSRSGTVNSTGSASVSNNLFLSPSSTVERTEEPEYSRPPIVKDIKIVTRFKGHTNTVNKVRFVQQDVGDTVPVYKLVSCGFDGKVLGWDFDYKALPKVKEARNRRPSVAKSPGPATNPVPVTGPQPGATPAVPGRKQAPGSVPIKPSQSFHQRNKSVQPEELNGLLGAGLSSMNRILNEPASSEGSGSSATLYRSLYDLRLKKHYTRLLGEVSKPKKHSGIIHPIVNDKLVPLVEIPSLTLDLSCLVKDCKLDGFFLAGDNFWVFAKSGDIFKYAVI